MTSTDSPPAPPALLPRIAAGESGLIQDCIDRYGALIWSMALRRTPSRQDAEDAVQEIFIDVWKSAARFDEAIASEKAFIAMIARRRLIDRRRKIDRTPDHTPITPVMEETRLYSEQIGEARAEIALAARAIAQLDAKERDVVVLSVHQGMSHSQIAEHTGLPLGTVKTYVRRGLMRVREMLADRSDTLEEAPTS